MQQSQVILYLLLGKTQSGKSHDEYGTKNFFSQENEKRTLSIFSG